VTVFSRQEQLAILVLVGLLLVSNGFLIWQNATRPSFTAAPPAEVDAGEEEEQPVGERQMRVHVAGEVQQPGVYSLAVGERVVDAIAAAGGVTSAADADRLNLAQPVEDGMRVFVPARAQAADDGGKEAAAADGLLDLNTASLAELQGLPGIGPALAGRIVTYREEQGPFQHVSDLLNVPGIGAAKLATLEDLVTVR